MIIFQIIDIYIYQNYAIINIAKLLDKYKILFVTIR
jgi:hypothetical protein